MKDPTREIIIDGLHYKRLLAEHEDYSKQITTLTAERDELLGLLREAEDDIRNTIGQCQKHKETK